MEKRSRRWSSLIGGTIGCFAVVVPALACQIPVFRYALERWEPDPYEVTVFHRGPLDSAGEGLVESLRAASRARDAGALDAGALERGGGFTPMTLELIDLEEAGIQGFRRLEDRYGEAALPAAVVHFPRKVGLAEPVWFGSLSDASVAQLLDSPVRQEVTKRILGGDSVVWVLVESGKQSADDAAYKDLVDALAALERRLQLPDIESIVSDEEYRGDTQVELKLSFSALRMPRTAAGEELFLAMLMGIEADLKDFAKDPIAIPIFGRGRALYGLTGQGINEDTIESACRNLVGPCSCTVKELNPGVDLLFSVDWNGRVTSDAAPRKEPPELPGPALAESDDAIDRGTAVGEVVALATSNQGATSNPGATSKPAEALAAAEASGALGEVAQSGVSAVAPEDSTPENSSPENSSPVGSAVGGPAVAAAGTDSGYGVETLVLPVAVVLAGGLVVVLVGSFLMLRSGGR